MSVYSLTIRGNRVSEVVDIWTVDTVSVDYTDTPMTTVQCTWYMDIDGKF